jgi:hypothetical protein
MFRDQRTKDEMTLKSDCRKNYCKQNDCRQNDCIQNGCRQNDCYGKVAHLELSSHQISELNNRLSMRNLISQISQRLALINQRRRHIL